MGATLYKWIIAFIALQRERLNAVSDQPDKVMQPRDDARHVASAVSVGVLERPRMNVMDDTVLPPSQRHASSPDVFN